METAEPEQAQAGRYRIERTLGAGGMGIVYLARDSRLQRRVAIKKLRRDATSTSAHLRIQREARLLARLNHGNIVQLYDVLEEDGDIALVMEYVEGCTLGQWVRDKRRSLQEKLDILVQICSGLEQAHALGIVHRDLKPDNILVSGDSPVTAKITDFGIAKSWREDSDLTCEQHIAGSWGLMSPEQAQGKSLDNRSDLFTLGTLAYQLLCGQNPFGNCDSPYVTVERIVHHPHPPAAKLNPQLPDALCKLLDRLMAKDPKRRPASAGEVAAILRDIAVAPGDSQAAELPVNSGRSATMTVESLHRHQGHQKIHNIPTRAAVLAAAAIALLAILSFFYLSGSPREEGGQYIAIVMPQAADADGREIKLLYRSVQNAIREGISDRRGLYLVPISESRALQSKPLRDMAGALNVQLLLSTEISCRRYACDLTLELIDSQSLSVIASRDVALDADANLGGYEKTLQQINYLLPDYPPRHPRPELQISEADYRRYLELETLHYRELQNAEILQPLEDLQQRAPSFAPIYELHSLGVFMARFENVDLDAVERLEKLLAKAPASIADTPELISARLNLAETRYDWQEADRQLARLKIALPDIAHYYHRVALDHHLRGEYEKELEAAERALAHRTSTNYLLQKAIALSFLGDMEGARPVLQRILEIDSGQMDAISLLAANELDMGRGGETIRLLKSAPPAQLPALDVYNLCTAYYLEQNFDEAAPCFEKLGELNPHDAEPLLILAEIARTRGRPEDARRLTERAIAETSRRQGWENKLVLAQARAQLGQHQQAVETLMQIHQRTPDDTYTNHAYAQVYITTGDRASAEAHIRRALELGQSPVWYHSARFAEICSHGDFADLRGDYPGLCTQKQTPTDSAQK